MTQAAIADVKTKILFPEFRETEFAVPHFLTAKTIRSFAPDVGAYPQAKVNSIGNAQAQGLPFATPQVLTPEGWMAEIPVNYAFPRPEDVAFWAGLAFGKITNVPRGSAINGVQYYLHTLLTNNDNDLRLLSSALTFIYEHPPSIWDANNHGLVERWDGVVMDRFSIGCEVGESQIASVQGQGYASGSFSYPKEKTGGGEFDKVSIGDWGTVLLSAAEAIGQTILSVDDGSGGGAYETKVGDVFKVTAGGEDEYTVTSRTDTELTINPGLVVAGSDNDALVWLRNETAAVSWGTVLLSAAEAIGQTILSVDDGSGGGAYETKVGDVFKVTAGGEDEYTVTSRTDTELTINPGLVVAGSDNDALVWLRNDLCKFFGDYFYVDHQDRAIIEGEALSGSSMSVYIAHRTRSDVDQGPSVSRRFPENKRNASLRNVALNRENTDLSDSSEITDDLFSWRMSYTNNINMAANRKFGKKRMARGHRGNPMYGITMEMTFERKRGLPAPINDIIEKAKAGDQFALQIVMTNAKLDNTQWKGILITIPAMQIQDHARGATNNQLNTTLTFEPVFLETDTEPIYIDIVDDIPQYHADISELSDFMQEMVFVSGPGQDSE